MQKGGELMAKELFIPKLGQTVEEVTLVSWLVEDGAKVDFGQPILEVETDKAIFPVEANAKGYLHRGPFKEGDVLPVLAVVATIGKPEEVFSTVKETPLTTSIVQDSDKHGQPQETDSIPGSKKTGVDKLFVSPRAKKLAIEHKVDLNQVRPTGGGGIRIAERDVIAFLQTHNPETRFTPKATPVAQKMAEQEGIDLTVVSGSGPGGKIIKQDVERTIEETKKAAQPTPSPVTPPLYIMDVVDRQPLKGIRAIIADRMAASVHTTARVTLLSEVDATELVQLRNRLKEKVANAWGLAPSYNDLIMRICAVALRQHPVINARLTPDAVEILGHINIGLAVDTERGLLVPVTFDVDQKNLKQITIENKQKIDRAREGRSLPDELTGGTFTITNLGMFDVDAFTPVINLPEAAILGVGRITPKPVVKGSSIEIRQMTTLSLAFDHRLIDGAPAARFLQSIKSLIEEPYLLLAN